MKHFVAIFSMTLLISFSACTDLQKGTIDADQTQTMLTEAVTAYGIYANAQEEATKAVWNAEGSLKSASFSFETYPQITIEPLNLTEWPKTITINFGPNNHLCADGRYRRGKLIVHATNFAHVQDAVWEITFDNFHQNDNKVEGIQRIKYLGTNDNNNPEFECSVSEGKITTPDEKIFYFEQQLTREWISGNDTHYVLTGNIDDLCDDEHLISGTHSGTSSDGLEYHMETTEPLLVNVCCKWVIDGNLLISQPGTKLTCEIDYRPETETGDLCNGTVSFTILGVTQQVSLD